MAKMILIEEFHLSLRVPAGLAPEDNQRICRTLRRRQFRAELLHAVRALMRRKPTLARARVFLSV